MRDEQKETDEFEALCGGVEKAQRLFRIYKDSYGTSGGWGQPGLSKDQVFIRRAVSEGFSQRQANALLDLQ